MPSRRRLRLQQCRTLLLVVEGETEEAFVNHLRKMYVSRGSGLKITVRCAHGKGAKHVVEYAARLRGSASFDRVAVLLDTDTDWTSEVQRLAKEKGIHVLGSQPCIEAVLLRAIGQPAEGKSRELKSRLAPFVNDNALDSRNYDSHFGDDVLQRARTTEPVLNDLLGLLNIEQW